MDKVTQKFSPPKKRKRSNVSAKIIVYFTVVCFNFVIFAHVQEDAAGQKQGKSSLSPEGELYKVPRLEKQFKKPPPHRSRRRPTKAHLKQMASPGSGGGKQEEDGFDLIII